MSESPTPPRVYNDKEIGKILERATELQRAEPTSSDADGITLAELEEIAVETGIDVRHLRRAAMEIDGDPGRTTLSSRLLGEALTLRCKTRLPGEVPERAFEPLLALVESNVPGRGQASLLGRTLTWQGGGTGSQVLRIVVSSRNGKTTVLVEENYTQMAGGLFGGLGGGIGLGLGLGVGLPVGISLASPLLAVALPTASIGLTYLGTRALYRKLVGRRRRAVNELFGRLQEATGAAIGEAVPGDD